MRAMIKEVSIHLLFYYVFHANTCVIVALRFQGIMRKQHKQDSYKHTGTPPQRSGEQDDKTP